MDDNLSLDSKIKARYEGMYSGVFYDRYIRGLWTVAEGLIYTMFNKDYHIVPSIPRSYEDYLISCDYGTLNPTSAGLWGLCEGKWYTQTPQNRTLSLLRRRGSFLPGKSWFCKRLGYMRW